jgi:uncharacterized protein YbjT (DUF2867 family)
MTDAARRVLIAGATGLVGSECLRLLAAEPWVSEIIVLARRELELGVDKARVRVVDFDALDAHAALFGVDQIFCALGTTMKQAGSREAFRRVDFDYALRTAELGARAGARHFLLVSSLGASPRARAFYSRTKGELEVAIGALPYRSLTIARPSVLLGERAEWRWKEEPVKLLGWLAPSRMKPVDASKVAAALVRAAREDAPGRRVLENIEIANG